MEILREILKEQWMEIPMEHKRVELMETDSACWMGNKLGASEEAMDGALVGSTSCQACR